MRARQRDEQVALFVTARTQDLHHDAYLLCGSRATAEQLVALVVAELARDGTDLTQAAATARLRMARTAAHADPLLPDDRSEVPARFRALAALTTRQRAILLLEVVDGYDRQAVADGLRLKPQDITESYAGTPLELTDADPAELRSLLGDFGDLADAPDPGTTLAAIHAVPRPPRRPWWTYAAACLVVALTVSTLWITQTWHDEWLRTATGLNQTHGTHFPAYTLGYKLVAIHDVAPGPIETVPAGPDSAMAVECSTNAVITISSRLQGDYQGGCSAPGRPSLTPVVGTAAVSINDFSRKSWPVAIYSAVPWAEYPVATSGFVVQHNQSLADIRHASADGYASVKPQVSGAVLTVRGDKNHPNGVFEARLPVPTTHIGSVLVLSGLLSPTTTGRYGLLVDGTRQWSNCGPANIVRYAPGPNALTCSIFDRAVPQISFSAWGVSPPETASVAVQVTVRDARGPWTLQLAYDSYKLGADGQPVPP